MNQIVMLTPMTVNSCASQRNRKNFQKSLPISTYTVELYSTAN
jgi:hypothetical protein